MIKISFPCAFSWLLSLQIALGPSALGQNGVQPAYLHVHMEESSPVDLRVSDLASFRRIDITGRDHEQLEHRYSGVALSDILRLAGVPLGNQLGGANMAQYLLARSVDGYQVVFALPELDSGFTDRTIILAYLADGEPFPGSKGPFQIIVPGENNMPGGSGVSGNL